VGVAAAGGAVVDVRAVVTGATSGGVAVALGGDAVAESVDALTAAGASGAPEDHAPIAIATTTTTANLPKGRLASGTPFTATAVPVEIGVR
jgi:hypothetical protein